MSAVAPWHTCQVEGRTSGNREASDAFAAAILLLHGLTGSSAEHHAPIRA
jgi:hypothetical protein